MKVLKIVYLYRNDLILGYKSRVRYNPKYINIDMFDLSVEQRLMLLEAAKIIFKEGRHEILVDLNKEAA